MIIAAPFPKGCPQLEHSFLPLTDLQERIVKNASFRLQKELHFLKICIMVNSFILKQNIQEIFKRLNFLFYLHIPYINFKCACLIYLYRNTRRSCLLSSSASELAHG